MKICFFSDVHGNLDAFHAFCKSIENKQIDMLVFGGDFFGYFYYPDEILTEMRSRNIRCIVGNHDQLFLDICDGLRTEEECIGKYGSTYKEITRKIDPDHVSFLRSLPTCLEMHVDRMCLGFFHGGPENHLNQRIYPDTVISETASYKKYDYIFVGHTHHKMVREVGQCKIINPGSIGQPRDGKGTSYVIFDTEKQQYEFQVFGYDKSRLLLDIERNESDDMMKEKLKESILRVRGLS